MFARNGGLNCTQSGRYSLLAQKGMFESKYINVRTKKTKDFPPHASEINLLCIYESNGIWHSHENGLFSEKNLFAKSKSLWHKDCHTEKK